jgi:hypothetical protein
MAQATKRARSRRQKTDFMEEFTFRCIKTIIP